MRFTVKCGIFNRLAEVTAFFEPTTPEEIKKNISCVRLEHHKGQSYAIVTNQKIAVIEYLGPTTEVDGVAHVVNDPRLIEQCKKEAPYDSILEVMSFPEVAVATAKTMLGYVQPGNACIWPDATEMDDWREWVAKKQPTENKGALFLNLDHVQTLVKASPSGKVIFPAIIDVKKPIILRDREFSNWVGIFMGMPLPSEPAAQPATLPTWWV